VRVETPTIVVDEDRPVVVVTDSQVAGPVRVWSFTLTIRMRHTSRSRITVDAGP
jgi:hypothetical protein